MQRVNTQRCPDVHLQIFGGDLSGAQSADYEWQFRDF
jgi:hypothetical protein